MATIAELCADVKRSAYGSLTGKINLIENDLNAGETQIVMSMDVTDIQLGSQLSCGLNVWYVRNVDSATSTVTVVPQYDGSPAAAVTAGDFVYVNPRVTDWYLFNMLNTEIVRLSSPMNGLYRVGSWTASIDPVWQVYDVPAEDAALMISLLRVRYRLPGSTDSWFDIPDRAYRMQDSDGSYRVRLLYDLPASGELAFFYKAPFVQATALSDDATTDLGIPATMTDIPGIGVLGILMRTTESRRTQIQSQGDSRRATEVQVGANLNIMRSIDAEYRNRVAEEYARLVVRDPATLAP